MATVGKLASAVAAKKVTPVAKPVAKPVVAPPPPPPPVPASLIPFSQFFDENKAREFWNAKFASENTAENNLLTGNDASWRRDNALQFKDNMGNLQQGLANNGALFGGVRQANERRLTESNQNVISDYNRQIEEQKRQLARSQNLRVDDALDNQKNLKFQEYENLRKKNSLNGVPGYSV